MLAKSGGGNYGSLREDVASFKQAGGGDVLIELQGAGQLDEGEVAGEVVGVPAGVGPAVVGGDLDTVGLAGVPHIVGAGHHVEVSSAVSAVGGGEDVVLGDDGAAAEPGVVDEESDLPGPGVLGGLLAPDDPVHGGALHAAGGLGLPKVLLVGGGGPHLGGNPLDLGHDVLAASLGDCGVPGLVLGEVPALCGPPVLFSTEPAALGCGRSQGAESSEDEELHVALFSELVLNTHPWSGTVFIGLVFLSESRKLASFVRQPDKPHRPTAVQTVKMTW